MDHRNPDARRVAAALGRTPSAVAMKLSNFASIDPEHQQRGVGGLANASRLDRAVWDRFTSDWSRLADAAEPPNFVEDDEPAAMIPAGPTTAERLVRARRSQHFFRRAVLTAYEHRCCVTGLASRPLLRAGHIKPWKSDESARLDPHNGLCLNALHDAAFDRGLMTHDEDMRVVYAASLWRAEHSDEAAAMLRQLEGVRRRLPNRHRPRPEFLAWHRERVFGGE